MTKILRRTRLKYQEGFDGQLNPLTSYFYPVTSDRLTGTDGEVFNSNSHTLGTAFNLANVQNTTPITVQSSTPHGLADGQCVVLTGTGITAVNGLWKITWVDLQTFTLQGSAASGASSSSGTGTPVSEQNRDTIYTPSILSRPEGGWQSADVGRIMILKSTPPTSGTAGTFKHDGWPLRISKIISSTVVQLSGARFEETGTGISWVLCACSEFTSGSAGFNRFTSYPIGLGGSAIDQHITISNPPAGYESISYAPLRVGAVLNLNPSNASDGTRLLVSDWTGNISSFGIDSSGINNLTWYLGDRPAYNFEDLFQTIHRFMISCGWSIKGRVATGTIIAGANPNDGDWVTIWDGDRRWTFEWNNTITSNGDQTGGTLGANHVGVKYTSGNATTNATNLASAINLINSTNIKPIWITATSSGSTVSLAGLIFDARANTAIFCGRETTGGGNSPSSFGAVTGMFGATSNGQFRGRNNGLKTDGTVGTVNDGLMQDCVYFSSGEGDDPSLTPTVAHNPKRIYARISKYNSGANVDGNGRIIFDVAMFQSWLAEYNGNGSTHNRGSGINPCKSGLTVSGARLAANPTGAVANAGGTWGSTGLNSLLGNLTNIYYEGYKNPLCAFAGVGLSNGELLALDYAMMGDKDEVSIMVYNEGLGINSVTFGSVQEIHQNPQRFMVRQAVGPSIGTPVFVDVGANVNPQGTHFNVTNPDGTNATFPFCQANDNIQVASQSVLTGAPTGGGFIESDTINAFGFQANTTTNPDGIDFHIQVNQLNKAYAIGDIMGEEACPLFIYNSPTNNTGALDQTNNVRFQNAAQNGDATFFDWNNSADALSTRDGFSGQDGVGCFGSDRMYYANFDKRGGRSCLAPVTLRNINQPEFRGRPRYIFWATPHTGFWSWASDSNGNWYLLVPYFFRQGDGTTGNTEQLHYAFGPVSLAQAIPYGPDSTTFATVSTTGVSTNQYGWGFGTGFYPP